MAVYTMAMSGTTKIVKIECLGYMWSDVISAITLEKVKSSYIPSCTRSRCVYACTKILLSSFTMLTEKYSENEKEKEWVIEKYKW